MPFSFENFKYYDVDFGEIRKLLLSMPLFNNDLMNVYVNNWVKLLVKSDEQIKNQTLLQIIDYLNDRDIKTENFEQIFGKDITFGNTDSIIHFNIPVIQDKISRKLIDCTFEKISVQYIIESDRYSYEIVSLKDDFVPKKLPIIIVEFNSSKDYLVIDGNHRLSYALKNRVEFIDCFYIKAIEMINNNYHFFASQYDKLLYTLINEFRCISLLKDLPFFTDERLFSSSYLLNGKFLFDIN